MKTYDYIVLGSGSAGSIVAARLSEDPGISILLLERGDPTTIRSWAMPIAFPKVAGNRAFIWPFETEPEPASTIAHSDLARQDARRLFIDNAMINVRGSRYDYDMWRQRGLEGWGYRDVLPYFKKLEASWRGGGLFHGAEGPVKNAPVDLPEAFFSHFEQAAMKSGLQSRQDHHGEGQGRYQSGGNHHEQWSPGQHGTRLPPPRDEDATKPHRADQGADDTHNVRGQRATGVEYLRDRKIERVHVDREVVLCAGTYASPQLLMLSGIGPADHLRSLGIDVVQDMPGVGQNLQEHPNLLNIYRASGKLGLTRHLRLDRATLAVARWALFGAGPFAMAGTTANIFLRTRLELERPDVQIITMPVHQHAELWFPRLTKPPIYAFTARVGILHALSRGWVKLRSSDSLDLPRIRFNMFAEQADMDTMVRAVKWSRELFNQAPLSDLVAEELLPGKELQTDAELEHAIRQQAEHRHHAIGTCRMGTDELAVVDAQLRVIGIENLRVADASVMPDDPSGNTNVPTMMIGEKAADLLKGRTLEPEEV